MVIDYLPRIPRIPYSDRPHGTKIEPSIADAPHSLSLFSLSPSPLPPLSLWIDLCPRAPVTRLFFSSKMHEHVISNGLGNEMR